MFLLNEYSRRGVSSGKTLFNAYRRQEFQQGSRGRKCMTKQIIN